MSFVGGWKEHTPLEIIKKKRAVDKAMYTCKPFFTDELFSTYKKIMDESFSPFGELGKDASIRSDIKTADGDRTIHNKDWNPNGKIASQKKEIKQSKEKHI